MVLNWVNLQEDTPIAWKAFVVTNNIYYLSLHLSLVPTFFACNIENVLSLSLSLSLCLSLSLSLQVQRRYNQGDYAGAQRASKLAYKWGSAAVMFGIAFMVIFVVLKLYFEDRHLRSSYYY